MWRTSPRTCTTASASNARVETGTFRGDTSVALSRIFREVVTIELAPALQSAAFKRFARKAPNVQALHGDSARSLRERAPASGGTFYFLDGIGARAPLREGIANAPCSMNSLPLLTDTRTTASLSTMPGYMPLHRRRSMTPRSDRRLSKYLTLCAHSARIATSHSWRTRL